MFFQRKKYLEIKKKFGNQFVAKNKINAQKKIVQEINPDMWIVDTPNKLTMLEKNVPLVQTLHSLPLKKHVFYKPILNSDLILFQENTIIMSLKKKGLEKI